MPAVFQEEKQRVFCNGDGPRSGLARDLGHRFLRCRIWKKSIVIFRQFVYNEHYIILFKSVVLFQEVHIVPISHLIYVDRAKERRKMDYTEFVRAVEKRVSLRLGESKKVSLHTATKNNGKEKQGIMVETKGVNVSPAIYLEEYYEYYRRGESLEEIVDEVVEFYESIRRDVSWDSRSILSYEGVRDRIVFRLVNTEKNREFLDTVPHRDMYDLSAVFYVLLEMSSEGTTTMTVKNSHMEQWETDVSTLWSDALDNSKRILPAEFFTMRYALSVLANDIPEKAEGAENLFAEKRRKKDRMYVLSNRLRSYGAACAAYPYVLKMIGQILKKDYYILPSSVHEVVIVPYSDEFDLCELDEMVKEINDTQLDEEDVLSDHAYFVDHRSGKVFADLDGEKRSKRTKKDHF